MARTVLHSRAPHGWDTKEPNPVEAGLNSKTDKFAPNHTSVPQAVRPEAEQ